MNRWILRGLTVAGFTAGAWLLGNAAAYAADTTVDTTTTIAVDVHLGTLVPSATPVLHRVAAVTTTALSRPAVHVHAVPAAAVSTTAPVAADARLGGCVDVAVNTAAGSCTAGSAVSDPGTANDPGAVPAGGAASGPSDTAGGTASGPSDTAAPAALVSGAGSAFGTAGTASGPYLSGPGMLPRTGDDMWSLVGVGVVLLMLGVALRTRTT